MSSSSPPTTTNYQPSQNIFGNNNKPIVTVNKNLDNYNDKNLANNNNNKYNKYNNIVLIKNYF